MIHITTRSFIKAAQIYSMVFSPFYAPFWTFIWLFLFGYLENINWEYKIFVLATVLLFTIIIPRTSIDIFRKINKWTHWQLSHREHRSTPYFITIASYIACVMIFINKNAPQFLRGIIIATLISCLTCAIVNIWWKVSTHMAGMGGLLGTEIAFSFLFNFNPIPMMCIMLLMSGIMGTSRMTLRQHSLSQVLIGFFIGLTNALVFILIGWLHEFY